jgi:hypothetical protein
MIFECINNTNRIGRIIRDEYINCVKRYDDHKSGIIDGE